MSREAAESEPRTVVFNGVGIPTVTPEEERDYWPDFEEGTSAALRRQVRRGDDVVVVGGGRGITTVVGARMTHFEGTVTTYEASSEMLATLRRTVEVNRVGDLVTLEHAAVGSVSDHAEELFGPSDGDRLDPGALPSCDVLELDCEGSELDVLRGMECRPRVVVVETHEPLGVPAADVCEVLKENEYRIVNRATAGANDELEVLTAVQSGE